MSKQSWSSKQFLNRKDLDCLRSDLLALSLTLSDMDSKLRVGILNSTYNGMTLRSTLINILISPGNV